VEPERDAGEESNLGVGRFDEGVGQFVFQAGVDLGSVFHDAAGEIDEGGDAAPLRPTDPVSEGLFAGVAFDGEHHAEPFFEQVSAV
jgi:hypothetical protein